MAKKGRYVYEWPRPMVTVDAVVFALSPNKARLLLIRRKGKPFKDLWAIPGGFVEMDEELEDAAIRELAEETGVTDISLEQMRTYGTIGRDPRGRLITVVFMGTTEGRQTTIRAGDDAADVRWFDIDKLPDRMAFDHNEIVSFAIRRLKRMSIYRRYLSDAKHKA
jgi:8-oxo-dGTP diphosphatase